MKNWKVWKEEKNYQPLFWSGIWNGIGNRFHQVAMLTLLYVLTGSSFAIGILFMIRSMLPFFGGCANRGGSLQITFPKNISSLLLTACVYPLQLFPLSFMMCLTYGFYIHVRLS
ncbi:hypothetical protein RWE15_11980 [Virgibacillus halophilus]|uniref:Uncharacterized protein n=1 Tax=Tigheibacillus halophilus TaxID=361280 RepID=A0ABU5C6P1_9BACI|nr:hypothetical protein [Virgibacillus halophilus]